METNEKAPVKTLTTANGHEIPVSRIRPMLVLQHETADEIRALFLELAEINRQKKTIIFEKLQAYSDLMFQEYGARVSGRMGGMALRTYDDHVEIKASLRHYNQLTPAIAAAQELLSEILDDLTEGVNEDLRAVVMRAFEKDTRTGNPSVDRILGLKQLNLVHPKWPDAVRALEDSVTTIRSKMAVTCHVRPDANQAREQIVVDFSRL